MKNYPTLLNGTFSSHVYSIQVGVLSLISHTIHSTSVIFLSSSSFLLPQSSIVVRTAVSAAAHMQGLFGGKGSPLLDGWDAFGSYSESGNEGFYKAIDLSFSGDIRLRHTYIHTLLQITSLDSSIVAKTI